MTYPITTKNEMAQRYFDQGLRWSYAFNHPEAIRAFRKAQEIDPECAMCYWGEAFALGPNINAPMDPSAVEPAFAAVAKAQALAKGTSERERALIAALAERYAPDPRADRAALDSAYAEAMAEAAGQFPDDHGLAVLYADAVMNTSPWDYWEADGSTPKGSTGEAVQAVERVLAEDPDHTFAIHLYIHLVEASNTPERAEPYADRLGATMPGAGHIVHMPSHIYFRIGRYMDSLASNWAAVATDEFLLEQIGDAAGTYAYSYYPHNVHFLLEFGSDGRGRRDGAGGGGQAADSDGRRGCARPAVGRDHQSRAILRSRPIQRTRGHARRSGSGERLPVHQGDVALRSRRRPGRPR